MADRKVPNRFSLQESGPVLLLIVVVIVGISFWMNRQEKMPVDLSPSDESLSSEGISSESVSDAKTQILSEARPQSENTREKYIASPQTIASNLPSSQDSGADGSSLQPAQILSPATPSLAPSMKKVFTIQVHSFQDSLKAEKDVESLLKKGYSGFVLKKDLKEKGIWYRVCIGEFENKTKAEEVLAEVKQTYKDSFVIVR